MSFNEKWKKEFNLSRWQMDSLYEFDNENCVEGLFDMANDYVKQEFISELADSVFTFKNKLKNKEQRKIQQLKELMFFVFCLNKGEDSSGKVVSKCDTKKVCNSCWIIKRKFNEVYNF